MTDQQIHINPHQSVPPEVAETFARIEAERTAAITETQELTRLTRPTEGDRDIQFQIFTRSDSDARELRERAARLRRAEMQRIRTHKASEFIPSFHRFPLDFGPPAPVDTTFWFASYTTSCTSPYGVSEQADGLHYTGKKTSDSGSLQFFHYGVKSLYSISHDRIPPSSTGRWVSAPHVELFGRLGGYTGDSGVFDGDYWSKCWMIRRQTLVQNAFGSPGPVPTVIGEATDVQPVFNEENSHRFVEFTLPGFQAMPAVVLPSILGGLPIWAELEVRFDVQLEGTAFHWIHPFDLLVRLFQWPLLPNA